jgi:hypothetical protein
MTNPDDLAFPLQFEHETVGKGFYTGLTKREIFAMTAMQGILSKEIRQYQSADLVRWSVEFADALISELNKKGGKA